MSYGDEDTSQGSYWRWERNFREQWRMKTHPQRVMKDKKRIPGSQGDGNTFSRSYGRWKHISLELWRWECKLREFWRWEYTWSYGGLKHISMELWKRKTDLRGSICTVGKTFPGSYGGENTFPEAMEMRIHLQRALEDNTYWRSCRAWKYTSRELWSTVWRHYEDENASPGRNGRWEQAIYICIILPGNNGDIFRKMRSYLQEA
jgi:hypothetical protein